MMETTAVRFGIRRWYLLTAGGLCSLLAFLAFGLLPAHAQNGTGSSGSTSSVPVGVQPVPSTVENLLAGPPTTATGGPPSTAAGSSSASSVVKPGAVKTKSADNRKVWAVVAGLVLVALCLAGITVGYARRTRPVRPDSEVGDEKAASRSGRAVPTPPVRAAGSPESKGRNSSDAAPPGPSTTRQLIERPGAGIPTGSLPTRNSRR